MTRRSEVQFVFVLWISLFLVSCSSVKIGYSLLDNVLRWKVDEYVTLDFTQKKAFNRSIDAFVEWHKRKELPRYASFIEQKIPVFKTAGITPQQLEQIIDEGVVFWENSLTRLMPGIAEMLISLRPEQIEELIANIDKKEKEYIDEHFNLSVSKLHHARQKRLIKRLRKFIGRLNSSQRARITQWSTELKFATKMRLKQRQTFRNRFVDLVAEKRTHVDSQQQVSQLFIYPETYWTPAYKTYVQESKQITYIMLADIFNSLSDLQRNRFIKKLKKYRVDMLALSR